MAHVQPPVNTAIDRAPEPGRQHRLTRRPEDSSSTDFRAMLEDGPESRPVSGWAGLLTPSAGTDPSVPAQPEPEPVPTIESVFGGDPWLAAPAGQGPLGAYSYNRMYFATAAAAAKVAEMAGGQVVERNFFTGAGSPFQQNQPNYMVELPDGRLINPGLVATYFTHGWSRAAVGHLLAADGVRIA